MADPPIHIRPARLEDAHGIASINVQVWQDAYAHIIDPVILAARSVDDAAARWWTYLSAQADDGIVVLVAEIEGRVVGYGSCGPQRDPDLAALGHDGEVTSLYVRSPVQRRGTGAALMRGLAAALLDHGHRSASLWVLEDNRTGRRFYERLHGALLDRRKVEARLGGVTEVAYAWADLRTLAELAPFSCSTPKETSP